MARRAVSPIIDVRDPIQVSYEDRGPRTFANRKARLLGSMAAESDHNALCQVHCWVGW